MHLIRRTVAQRFCVGVLSCVLLLPVPTASAEDLEAALIDELKILQQLILELAPKKNKMKVEEKLLAIAQKQYAELSESIAAGIVLTTFEGKIIDANAPFQELTDYARGELQAMPMQALTSSEWQTYDGAVVGRMLKERYVRYDKAFLKRDGTQVPVTVFRWVVFVKKNKKQFPGGMGYFVYQRST